MPNIKNLSRDSQGKQVHNKRFENSGSEYSEKLMKMGFVEGTPVERTGADINDPMVFSLRHSRVALRKKEAQVILVRESD